MKYVCKTSLDMTCRSLPHRCHRAAFVTLAQSQPRSTKASAATSSSAPSLDWHSNSTQVPLDDLPEPDGDWSLPFIGETPEFKANHWEWARKRWLSGHRACLMIQRVVPQHVLSYAAGLYAAPGVLPVSFFRRVAKYGPVFRSNIFGSDVIVVTDFVGLQKVSTDFGKAPCSANTLPLHMSDTQFWCTDISHAQILLAM